MLSLPLYIYSKLHSRDQVQTNKEFQLSKRQNVEMVRNSANSFVNCSITHNQIVLMFVHNDIIKKSKNKENLTIRNKNIR